MKVHARARSPRRWPCSIRLESERPTKYEQVGYEQILTELTLAKD
jgi:hypothetical protein